MLLDPNEVTSNQPTTFGRNVTLKIRGNSLVKRDCSPRSAIVGCREELRKMGRNLISCPACRLVTILEAHRDSIAGYARRFHRLPPPRKTEGDADPCVGQRDDGTLAVSVAHRRNTYTQHYSHTVIRSSAHRRPTESPSSY